MAGFAIGLQRPVCSIVEIGRHRVMMLTVSTTCVGMLSAYPLAIDRLAVLAGCLGSGLFGFLIAPRRSLLLGHCPL